MNNLSVSLGEVVASFRKLVMTAAMLGIQFGTPVDFFRCKNYLISSD
jgi:hypothetical protein